MYIVEKFMYKQRETYLLFLPFYKQSIYLKNFIYSV